VIECAVQVGYGGHMKLPVTFLCSALAGATALWLCGCAPAGQSQADEEREPHFMAGKSRVSTLDYKNALESFEKALEVNPRSAAAHFELACLYDQKEADPAAAIYHYESYLRLRPEAGNADVVKQRVMTCKQELARNVSLGPLTERQQRELEQLAEENKKLNEQIKRLNEDLDKWRAYGARLQFPTNTSSAGAAPSRPATLASGSSSLPSGAGSTATATANRATDANPATAARIHIIKAGETATVIARKYGVRVDALLAANPRVDSRRLQVGSSLTIPAP
jgi:tetratricopeptide (TPR) repeat protein